MKPKELEYIAKHRFALSSRGKVWASGKEQEKLCKLYLNMSPKMRSARN